MTILLDQVRRRRILPYLGIDVSERDWFVADSPLEGSGFELLVPQFSPRFSRPAFLRRISARLSKEDSGVPSTFVKAARR
jgi:hypothetical protein